MRKILSIISITIMLLSVAKIVMAASVSQGEVVVRIDDSQSQRCINFTTDRISIHLRRIIVEKDIGTFTTDKEVGLVYNTTIEGTMGEKGDKVKFPGMIKTNIESYGRGKILLPIEKKLIHDFALSYENAKFNSITVDFTILKKRSKNEFGIALSSLVDITAKLPIPSNPYSEGFKYFAEYANKTIENSINDSNNVSESIKGSNIELAFSPTDNCSGDQEKTGTIAVIKAANGSESNGYIDISKDYCWRSQFKPVFQLYFANKVQGGCNGLSDTSFRILQNPYYAFFIVSRSKDVNIVVKPADTVKPNTYRPLSSTLTGSKKYSEIKEDKITESIARCKEHGIEEIDCF